MSTTMSCRDLTEMAVTSAVVCHVKTFLHLMLITTMTYARGTESLQRVHIEMQ